MSLLKLTKFHGNLKLLSSLVSAYKGQWKKKKRKKKKKKTIFLLYIYHYMGKKNHENWRHIKSTYTWEQMSKTSVKYGGKHDAFGHRVGKST